MHRTLSSEVPSRVGETVRLQGWVHALRTFREVKFLVLRDRAGLIQTVANPDSSVDISDIGREYVVDLEGRVVADERAPCGAEVHITALKVLVEAEEPPLEIHKPAVLSKVRLDKLLDHRSISVRAPHIKAIFEVQAELLWTFGEYLRSQGFTEFKSSKIVATGTEGGANLFEINYFNQTAYLAQSPQFYKQIMVGSGMERVFEIAQVYRAEKHETSRHINEYTSLDYEMGFIEDEQDVIAMQVGLMRHMLDAVSERCSEQVNLLGVRIPEVGDTIPQLTFEEATKVVEARGHPLPEGDLDPEGERLLCEWSSREHDSELVYIVGFPLEQRPVYTYFRENDPGTSRSFDLLLRGLEITTGSQRIHQYGLLVEKMRERGLDPAQYDYYLSAFRHGMPPHGGLAIGLERLTMQLLGLSNVKEATLFPRDRNRLIP